MGWASGSTLYTKLIRVLAKEVPDEKARRSIHRKMIDAFFDEDWDTADECTDIDPVFDAALQAAYRKARR